MTSECLMRAAGVVGSLSFDVLRATPHSDKQRRQKYTAEEDEAIEVAVKDLLGTGLS